MKRLLSLVLLLALTLSACGGGNPEKDVDLQSVFDSLTGQMPEMLVLDETLQLNLLGVDSADCQQAVTAICADSVRVDEVWLVQARDASALKKLTALAESRVEAQAEVCQSYAPDQYAVLQKAELFTDGMYLVLLIGPEAAAMKQTVAASLR